jgi:hypothetical protein
MWNTTASGIASRKRSSLALSDLGTAARQRPIGFLYPHAFSRFKRPRRPFSCRYNEARPHRGLQLSSPLAPTVSPPPVGAVRRRDRLSGLIHEYYRKAA